MQFKGFWHFLSVAAIIYWNGMVRLTPKIARSRKTPSFIWFVDLWIHWKWYYGSILCYTTECIICTSNTDNTRISCSGSAYYNNITVWHIVTGSRCITVYISISILFDTCFENIDQTIMFTWCQRSWKFMASDSIKHFIDDAVFVLFPMVFCYTSICRTDTDSGQKRPTIPPMLVCVHYSALGSYNVWTASVVKW